MWLGLKISSPFTCTVSGGSVNYFSSPLRLENVKGEGRGRERGSDTRTRTQESEKRGAVSKGKICCTERERAGYTSTRSVEKEGDGGKGRD